MGAGPLETSEQVEDLCIIGSDTQPTKGFKEENLKATRAGGREVLCLHCPQPSHTCLRGLFYGGGGRGQGLVGVCKDVPDPGLKEELSFPWAVA